MIIKKITINEMIRECNKLTIPFYQREYVWEEKEVKKLLEDIINNENNEYFIGSLVFKVSKGTRIVIDGQQRLSTIWLILKALYKVGIDKKYTNLINKLKKENVFEIQEHLKYFEFNVESLKDGNVLNKIIKNNSNFVLYEKEKETNYYLNFERIKKFFEMYIGRLNEFYDKFKKLISSYVEVDENVDEHILFSQINSTGKKLSAFDLFKNNLLSKINLKLLKIGKNDLLDEKIHILNNIFSRFNNKDYKINNVDKFKDEILRHFISYITGYLPNSNQESIYDEYLKMEDKYFNDKELELFEKFCNFTIVYRFVRFSFDENKNYKFNDILTFFNNSFSTYCVLIIDIILRYSNFYDYEISINDDQENSIYNALLVLEIYKIKRAFVDLKEKILTRFIPNLSKEINSILSNENLSKKFDYSEILYFYLNHFCNDYDIHKNDLPKYRMPNENEFKNQFSKINIYNYAKFCREFLIRLCQFENKTRIDFSNFSIEHVMPQNLSIWKNNGYDESEEEISEVLHTIGNLTLTPNNSKYSNNLFLDKVKQMKLNESCVLNNYFFVLTEWNVAQIKERSNDLYHQTLKNWNFKKIENKIELNISLLNSEFNSKNKILDDSNDKYKFILTNRSHFKKIKEITFEKIKEVLFQYLVNGLSYEKIEMNVFNMNFIGYVTESINKYFGILANDKKSYSQERFNDFIDYKDGEINELVSYLNKF